ncbi:MAG: dihydrodipicolinate synthase family protein [Planctomycetaceae bacterium]
MKKGPRLNGLIAATYTPMYADGRLRLDLVEPMVERLIADGVAGLYVCGSTGEGMSLSTVERQQVTEAYVAASRGRLPVIVQVGHNSLAEARILAEHAASTGADIISATCPSYFKVPDESTLIDCMADLASAAPATPFYYYHIPALTGSAVDIVKFLEQAGVRIPSLVGLKYTDTKLFEFQCCLAIDNGAYDVVWGCDEMLLGALATGAKGAIGSTYNAIAPVYHRLISAFERGDIGAAQAAQMQSIQFIRSLYRYKFHPAMKVVLSLLGIDAGPCRLPLGGLSTSEIEAIRAAMVEGKYLQR